MIFKAAQMSFLAYGYHFLTSIEVLIKTQGSPYDSKVMCQKKWGTFQGIFQSMNSVFELKFLFSNFHLVLILGMSSN